VKAGAIPAISAKIIVINSVAESSLARARARDIVNVARLPFASNSRQ